MTAPKGWREPSDGHIPVDPKWETIMCHRCDSEVKEYAQLNGERRLCLRCFDIERPRRNLGAVIKCPQCQHVYSGAS